MRSLDKGPQSAAEPLPLLLLVASPSALQEASVLGGSIFLNKLAEQLLDHLGSRSSDEGTVNAEPPSSGLKTFSWGCQLRTKYYVAQIRACMVQQQASTGTQEQDAWLIEPPEAVVFICSRAEQDQLHQARDTLVKISSQTGSEPAAVIEPLAFMKQSFVRPGKHRKPAVLQKEKACADGNSLNDWWVRDVPLKFILSLHCTSSGQRGCCSDSSINSTSNDKSESLISNSGGDTVVWNIGGDVFLEGLEICFVGERTSSPAIGSSLADAEEAAATAIAQQSHRLRKIAEALHCHMWPGLSRLITVEDKTSRGNCISTVSSDDTSSTTANGTVIDATSEKNIGHQSAQRSASQPQGDLGGFQQKDDLEGPCAVMDAESFDALAAAMLDLKQRGPAVASKDRRHAAMMLASRLAALTMCDED